MPTAQLKTARWVPLIERLVIVFRQAIPYTLGNPIHRISIRSPIAPLTLTNSTRPLPSRLISVSLCAAISCILTACSPDSAEQSNKTDAEQTTSEAPKLDALLDQGFYGEELVLDSDSVTPALTVETDLQDDMPTEQPTASLQSERLIEDLGFSGAQETVAERTTAPAYCLNYNNSSIQEVKQDECDSISNRLASVSKKSCTSASLRDSGCSSVDGFPILFTEFPPLAGKQPQGRILVIGGTHGDELTSVSVVFRWIEKLNKFHSGLFHWHIAPMMNPDGVLNREASRTNKNGVDLNRNMPSDDWEENAIDYWTTRGDKNPRRFPGNKAASEPETQWLIDEINAFQPDAIISVHAPYGVVDFDSLLLNTAPKSLGKLHLNLLGTYPGSLGNYAGINRNIPVITLELPHAWEMPSERETTRIWEDIVSWLRKNIDNRTELAASQSAQNSASE